MAKQRRKTGKRKSIPHPPASIIEATRVPLRIEAEAAGAPRAQLLHDIARILIDWSALIAAILRVQGLGADDRPPLSRRPRRSGRASAARGQAGKELSGG